MNGTNNWTSDLIEYSLSGFHNVVTEKRNITNFEDKSVLALSIDLRCITSPNKFRIAYYTIVTYNDSSKIIDITGWIDVPPAQFSLSSSPSLLILTKSQTMDIGAQLMSNTGVLPNVLNFTPENNQSWISVQYNPDNDDSSSFHPGPGTSKSISQAGRRVWKVCDTNLR